MEPRARYVFVGSIIVALIVGFLAALFWLSRLGGNQNSRHYTIYFAKQSLSGLQTESPVTVRGIKLGSVKSIEISATNIEQVKVIIQLDPSAPVRESTRAVIVRNLLTGIAGIDLIGSTERSPPLTEILPGEQYPAIREGTDTLQSLTASVPDLMKTIDKVLVNATVAFSEENTRALAAILQNLEQVTENLAKTAPHLTDTLEEVSKTATALKNNLETLTSTADTAVGNLNTSANSIVLDFRTLSRDISKAARSMSTTMEKLNDPRSIIRGTDSRTLGPGEEIRP